MFNNLFIQQHNNNNDDDDDDDDDDGVDVCHHIVVQTPVFG